MNEFDKAVIQPRPASTVILVRQKHDELQVYLLKRSRESRFFPAIYVFPGGGVEPVDSDYEDLDAFQREVETRSWGDALLPRMITLRCGTMILEPWDPLYREDIEIDEENLKEAVLPPGEPFSRIWYYEGIWRPVRN